MTSTTKKIAAIAQLCSTSNKLSNLYNIAKCAGWAKKSGASMLFLPECFGFMGSSAIETLANAESIPSPIKVPCENNEYDDQNGAYDYGDCGDVMRKLVSSSSWCSSLEDVVMRFSQDEDEEDVEEKNNNLSFLTEKHKKNDDISILHGLQVIARKSNLYISAGGIHELGAPPIVITNDEDDNAECKNVNAHETKPKTKTKDRVYNTHLILNNKGEIIAKYRKIHLFDVSIPSKNIHLRESATTAAGTKLVVCDSPIGKLGLSTCYDLRFPEMYQQLSSEKGENGGGADILLVPSAFTVPTGKAHWHTLLRGEWGNSNEIIYIHKERNVK